MRLRCIGIYMQQLPQVVMIVEELEACIFQKKTEKVCEVI
jgi:hypothetical protein